VELEVRQEDKNSDWFMFSGSTQARDQVKNKRRAPVKKGPPAEPPLSPVAYLAKKESISNTEAKKNTMNRWLRSSGSKHAQFKKQRSVRPETNYQEPTAAPFLPPTSSL
jgi:hypothetical protein